MLKTLFKKQFAELNKYYFYDAKTGKRRRAAGTAFTVIMFALLFCFLGATFYFMAEGLSKVFLTKKDSEWIYFALVSILAIMLGTFGSVFNTYASLYKAKDNDTLLSMPIKPSVIIFVRMTGVFAMSLLYSAVVWVPSCIRYWVAVSPNFLQVLFPIIMQFLLAGLVTVLTSVLGLLVAIVSNKIKNKTLVTVIVTLVFMALYYVVYVKVYDILGEIALYEDKIVSLAKWIYPIYCLALGSCGNVLYFLLFFAMTAALLMLCVVVISKSFFKTVTSDTSSGGKKNKKHEFKSKSELNSLVGKEFRKFFSSPTYILNAGLGVIIMLIAFIAALIKSADIRFLISELTESLPFIKDFIPVVIFLIIATIVSMDCYTAPSISLEGRSIWILQSLPVDIKNIFTAKETASVIINIFPAVILAVSLPIIAGAGAFETILVVINSVLYVYLSADLGLYFGIKKANVNWTNETVPIKQSFPVFITTFGGMVLNAALCGLYWFLCSYLAAWVYLLMLFGIYGIILFFTRNYIMTKGAEKFKNL